MNYQELLIKDLEEVDKKLYKQLKKSYDYDCVIFIARGAYLIGKDFSSFNNVPLLEIYASRKGGKLKKLLRPFLVLIPEKLKVFLRRKEMNSSVHAKNPERDINYNIDEWEKYKNCKKILVVDDSVDTGYSILAVKNAVFDFFKNAEVKVAALNYFEKAKDVCEPDYYLYENTMIKGPWSNDSKENKVFLQQYQLWKEN